MTHLAAEHVVDDAPDLLDDEVAPDETTPCGGNRLWARPAGEVLEHLVVLAALSRRERGSDVPLPKRQAAAVHSRPEAEPVQAASVPRAHALGMPLVDDQPVDAVPHLAMTP